MVLLGLRTVNHPAPDLAASRAWCARLLGIAPCFDEPVDVGSSVGCYELALDPSGDPATGPTTDWGVADAETALAALLAAGATDRGGVQDVGDGIRAVTVLDPGGSVLGVIEDPRPRRTEVLPGEGPGR